MTLTDAPSDGGNPFEDDDAILNQAIQALGRLEIGDGEGRGALEQVVDAYRRRLLARRRLLGVQGLVRLEINDLWEEIARQSAEIERTGEELEQTRKGLIQAEQMAVLGGMVAGVAHEVSTPMGVALTAASYLAEQTQALRRVVAEGRIRKTEFDDYLKVASEAADVIQANARRAAELMHGFKRMAADQTSSERRIFNLRHLLDEVLISLSPRLRQGGHRVSIGCAETIEVDSYPGALSQILTNLIMNSMQHGYDRGQSGVLQISVREIDPDQLELYYADDGKGVPIGHQKHIFDPFFTTRRNEGGTGLGLHIVSTIARNLLKGSVALEPLEKGTAFRVCFPRGQISS